MDKIGYLPYFPYLRYSPMEKKDKMDIFLFSIVDIGYLRYLLYLRYSLIEKKYNNISDILDIFYIERFIKPYILVSFHSRYRISSISSISNNL